MRRRRRTTVIGAGVAVGTALLLSGCVLDACPAVGYIDTAPVVLSFADPLPSDATVRACFGDGCEPAEVPAPGSSPDAERTRRVPQRPPYLDTGTMQPADVRVVVATDAAVLHDAVHRIPVRSSRTGLTGQCPGPWSYQPVEIDLDSV